MAWTARKRAGRNPKAFDSHGDYRGGGFTNFGPKKQIQLSEDTEIRLEVRKEIEERCEKALIKENIDDVVSEIAQRKKIKENFSYWTKNGLDIAKMLKGLYESYKRYEEKNKDEGR